MSKQHETELGTIREKVEDEFQKKLKDLAETLNSKQQVMNVVVDKHGRTFEKQMNVTFLLSHCYKGLEGIYKWYGSICHQIPIGRGFGSL